MYFFILVLRVKLPLRIWLLPDSEWATGSALTRDVSKYRHLESAGPVGKSCPRVSLHFLGGHKGRPLSRIVTLLMSERHRLCVMPCDVWFSFIIMHTYSSFLQDRGSRELMWYNKQGQSQDRKQQRQPAKQTIIIIVACLRKPNDCQVCHLLEVKCP